jgi:hypothetical protein
MYQLFPRLNTNVINLTVHWPCSTMHLKSIRKMHFANFTSKSINDSIGWMLSASSSSPCSRAGLLLHLERYQEALVELEELRQIAPKESLVYYLLSKVSDRRARTLRIDPCKWAERDDVYLFVSGPSTSEEFPLFLHVHVVEYGS